MIVSIASVNDPALGHFSHSILGGHVMSAIYQSTDGDNIAQNC